MNLSTLATRCLQHNPKKIHLILPAALMAILYWLSSIPGEPLPDDPQMYALFYWVSPSLQNVLHIPAYAALGVAWRWVLGAWLRGQTWIVASAFTLSGAYGVIDEWHQSFVPHRYASATDVALDLLGSALGLYLFQWALQRTRVVQD